MVRHTCNLSTQKVEGSAQGWPLTELELCSRVLTNITQLFFTTVQCGPSGVKHEYSLLHSDARSYDVAQVELNVLLMTTLTQ